MNRSHPTLAFHFSQESVTFGKIINLSAGIYPLCLNATSIQGELWGLYVFKLLKIGLKWDFKRCCICGFGGVGWRIRRGAAASGFDVRETGVGLAAARRSAEVSRDAPI